MDYQNYITELIYPGFCGYQFRIYICSLLINKYLKPRKSIKLLFILYKYYKNDTMD